MRILHVVPSYIPAWRYGGPIHSVHGLCRALAARGHEVDVATTSVNGPEDSPVALETPVGIDGVRVHYFRSSLLRRLYYAPRMRAFIGADKPRWDLIHTHSVFLWPTTMAARVARRRRIPYVLSPRGMLVADLIARRNALLKRAWIGLFERANVHGAAAVHVTSPSEREEMLALGLRPRAVFEVPNGVELDVPRSDAANTSATLPRDYVLFLGRLSWKKGLDRLVAAMARVPGVPLVIAGNDDEDLWPGLQAEAARLSIAGRVHRVGFADREAKARLLAGCLLLALPSRSENFGNVVLEAMAAGAPVVVTPEVGLAHVVAETGSGLVAEGDPRQFAAAIARLAGDAATRAGMGANGRRAAAGYTWDAVAARMEAEYARLAAHA